jgi:ankyrin repeat protein
MSTVRTFSFLLFFGVLLSACAPKLQDAQKSLFEAIKAGDTAKVKKSLAEGAKVNDPETPGGWSALHYAVRDGNEAIVKLLLEAGANPDYSGIFPAPQGGTPAAVTPLVVAQMSISLIQDLKKNPLLRVSDPAEDTRYRAPDAEQRYQRIIDLLEKAKK